jgi:hypothetical protein
VLNYYTFIFYEAELRGIYPIEIQLFKFYSSSALHHKETPLYLLLLKSPVITKPTFFDIFSLLLICLVYFLKKVLMNERKYNMIRSVCRSLEILLFFIISIVGFGLCAKTTSSNSKTKIKSLIGEAGVSRELALPYTTPRVDSSHLHRFFTSQHQKKSLASSSHSINDDLYGIASQPYRTLPSCDQNRGKRSFSSPLRQPGNLFQQNPVLLI